MLNIGRDVVPSDGRIPLMFNLTPFRFQALQPSGDLLTSCGKIIEGDHLVLIRINQPLHLSLYVPHLGLDPMQLLIELPVLPVLDLLP